MIRAGAPARTPAPAPTPDRAAELLALAGALLTAALALPGVALAERLAAALAALLPMPPVVPLVWYSAPALDTWIGAVRVELAALVTAGRDATLGIREATFSRAEVRRRIRASERKLLALLDAAEVDVAHPAAGIVLGGEKSRRAWIAEARQQAGDLGAAARDAAARPRDRVLSRAEARRRLLSASQALTGLCSSFEAARVAPEGGAL